jgi:hypothetical protein
MLTTIALCALTLTGSDSPSSGEETEATVGPTRGRLDLKADLSGRYNPLGLELRVTGSYRKEIGAPAVDDWPSPYIQGGIGLGLSPASTSASVHAEWMQLAFLVLRVQGDLFRYFGTNGVLLEFPDAHAPFGDEALEALAGRELSRFAGRLLLRPTLQAKVGRVVLRNQTDLSWYHFGEGGPYFREPQSDSLLKDGDGLVANRTVVLVELWSSGKNGALLAGPHYDWQKTFTAGIQRQRLSGVISFCPADRLGIMARPRINFQAGLCLQDRNREGQFFVGGGIGADFDL